MDFKSQDDFFSEQYSAGDKGVVVYLESTDDVFIFKKWFGDLLAKIHFESASGGKADGGFKVVKQKVNHFENNIGDYYKYKAYGVVDRDSLAHDQKTHNIFWEVDDNAFYASSPFGDKIFILNRWEVENYLLYPEVLNRKIANITMGEVPHSDLFLAGEILRQENEMMFLTAHAILGGGHRSPGYCRDKNGDELKKELRKDVKPEHEQDFDTHLDNITKFAEEKSDPIERWDRLSRILDGKRAMVRIEKMLQDKIRQTSKKIKIKLEHEKGDLADYFANSRLVDKHMQNLKSWLYNLE